MKIPILLIRKKKLRASTARRSIAAADEMDYEEMSEPNMKLSRALLIVLVLHVVAVAGIIAFNAIKSRQGAFPPPKTSGSPARVEATQPAPIKKEPVVNAASSPTNAVVAPKSGLPTDESKLEEAKILKAQPVEAAGGNFYVVAKGDNPVKIAKKLKVSESDLLAVNHIDDPRKLQIGQKLIVPVSKKPKSKSAGN